MNRSDSNHKEAEALNTQDTGYSAQASDIAVGLVEENAERPGCVSMRSFIIY
jgi:hypothetical protein